MPKMAWFGALAHFSKKFQIFSKKVLTNTPTFAIITLVVSAR